LHFGLRRDIQKREKLSAPAVGTLQIETGKRAGGKTQKNHSKARELEPNPHPVYG